MLKKSRALAFLLSASMVFTSLGTDLSLVANAEGNDKNEPELLASFDFNSTENGFSGGRAVATPSGDVSLSDDAVFGKSLYLDGKSWLDVTTDDGNSLIAGREKVTFSYVRKYEGGTGWTVFAQPEKKSLSWGNDGNKEYYLGIIDSGASITVERFMNGRGNGSLGTSESGRDWELVTVCVDTDKTYIYVNGEFVATSKGSEYNLAETLGQNPILQIGRANWNEGEFFQGYIDNFEIYDGILSEEKIAEMGEAFINGLNSKNGVSEEVTDRLAADLEWLSIPNANEIRGNITLPETGKYGSSISWTSSNTEVVTDKAVENEGYAATPAGVVTRKDVDTSVVLTATLENEGKTETKTFELKVLAKAEQKETTDYLFAYFTGNTVAGENIYFATSRDGYTFKEINNSEYVLTSEYGEKGLRDPYILRSHEGDKFYIIATDLSIGRNGDWTRAQKSGSQAIMVWESTDLVNWSDQRMVTITDSIDAGCTWAPEAYYDEITGEYVVFWASKVKKDNYSLQRIYYSKTRDFVSFTEPEVWIDRETISTIDTTVVAGNDGYLYRISKNEGQGTWNGVAQTQSTVYMERSKSLFGTWEKVDAKSLETIGGVEGPTSYKINSDDANEDTWAVLLDHFGGNGYAPVVTTDLASGKFSEPSSYKLPSAPRHGTVLNITEEEYKALKEAYDNSSSKYLYFFDCGVFASNETAKTSAKFEELFESSNLINEVPDQIYEEGSFGIVNKGNENAGLYDSNPDDIFSNGWWARGGKDIEYIVPLSNGEYTATGYFNEWWGCDRPMTFNVEYTNDDGEKISKSVDVALSGSNNRLKEKVEFNVTGVTGRTEVHFIARKAGGSDPVMSGLSIEGEPDGIVVEEKNTIKLDPTKLSRGYFEGWGTSLCWWANRLGYDEGLTNQAAELFFSDNGLDLNIGRYNVGGGDLVGEVKEIDLTNPKALAYDLTTAGRKPEYAGSNMGIDNLDLSGTTYIKDDYDFGFKTGAKGSTFSKIGWINKLNDSVGSGDNLHYTVNVDEAGKYTVKLLLTLTGTNSRDVAIRVNGSKDYVCDTEDINSNLVAKLKSGNNVHSVYIATIKDVELQKGENKINIGGVKDWTLDFMKMLVIKNGDEATSFVESASGETQNEFLHKEHIKRSDSVIPGYCVDVTRMDLSNHDLSYYKARFTRVDETSGFAWNYDWDADERQMNIMIAAAKASGDEFIAEAFSNSPPYFMTVSGCSSGNSDAGEDNLREDCVTAFACYMADVIEHINNENNGIVFQSATGMNEPYTNYWSKNSAKQEGCHFDQGESQSRVIVALNKELKAKGINLVISASDETSIDTAITSYKALSSEAKKIVERIDTHTYSGSKRTELSDLATSAGKNLWMSEVDGSFAAGINAGEMSSALGLGQRIATDVEGLDATAWILWNAVDMNVDANNEFDPDSIEALKKVKDGYNPNGGYWGIAIGDHNNMEIVLTKKYYGFGQYTKYIRPGMRIIGANGDTLAAYDEDNKQLVFVAINATNKDKKTVVDLSKFKSVGTKVTAIRTSGSLETGENWADVSNKADIVVKKSDRLMTTTLLANSITTYIIENVVYDADFVVNESRVDDAIALASMEEIKLTEDMVTGSTPWKAGQDEVVNIVDDNTSTFFDGLENGYALIDLGKAAEIEALAYAPRKSYASRMSGGKFYGSLDGYSYELIYEVPNTPVELALTYVLAKDFESGNKYRYIRYEAALGQCANIAEVKLFGKLTGDKKTVYDSITGVNGDRLYDNNGQIVQAHGGQIQKLTVNGVTKYYWIGEDKTNGYRPCPGIHMYSSEDLYNWTDEGLVLRTMSEEADFDLDYFKALYGGRTDGKLSDEQKNIYADLWQGTNGKGCVIERPKMLYNDLTKQYVIYFHADGNTPYDSSDSDYGKARLGIAVSDTVNGPYKLLGTYLLHTNTGYDSNWDNENGHVRDMNVFKDDDGSAYVIYSSDGNANMYIAKLDDTYTALQKSGKDEHGNPVGIEGVDYTVNFVGESREAPAMFKSNGKYYMISSGCTGWAANAARYAVADSVLGPWKLYGNPCVSTGAGTTYDTQSTCIVDLGDGCFMYMGDRWYNPDKGYLLSDSRYVWLPLLVEGKTVEIQAMSDWTLDMFGLLTPSGTDTGIVDGRTIYYFDCANGIDGTADNDEFDTIKEILGKQLKNSQPDQSYTSNNGAGFAGENGVDVGVKFSGADKWSHGYWARGNKTIDYRFDLAAGSYIASLGFQEWWNTNRDLRITVYADGEVIRTVDFTLRGDDVKNLQTVSFDLEKAAAVVISVSKRGNPDGVLSWISLAQTDLPKEDTTPEVKPVNPSVPGTTGGNTSASTSGASAPAVVSASVNTGAAVTAPTQTTTGRTQTVAEAALEETEELSDTTEETPVEGAAVSEEKEKIDDVVAIDDEQIAAAGEIESGFPNKMIAFIAFVVFVLAFMGLFAVRKIKK